ncbi:MAG: ATP-binding protein [Saprospiraceae bacterium]|nr:ATP-binding protein [Saprospiraceae bacterium]MCC6841914.1 ATP-binding protein [Saprospiraceae bacterium]
MNAIRAIKKEIDIYIHKYPILVLTGPRQSGKTTFLKTHFPDYVYVSLENIDNRRFATQDPDGFLKQFSRYVIFDEAQRVPELFSYLQTKVDEDKIMGQYILSGSQNFHLMQSISQSLAGRVALFKLLPFDIKEMQNAKWLNDDYAVNLYKGFYPAIYDRDIPSKVFYSNYLQTYVERDLSELIQVKDLRLFRNFISLCAARAGQLLNLNSIANECGISQPTARSWISVLETSYIVYQLQPYYANFNKRITKSSKLYFYDTGLLCHLLKIKDADSVKFSPYKGSLFENYVINEYIKQNYHQNLLLDFWFWRDAIGHEVDLIWQNSEMLNLVEIKASETIMPDMFKGLKYFEKLKHEMIESKTLVHSGLFNQERSAGSVKSWKSI